MRAPWSHGVQFSVRGVVFGRERVHLVKVIAVVYALGLIRAASGKAVYLLLGASDSGSFLLIPGCSSWPEEFLLGSNQNSGGVNCHWRKTTTQRKRHLYDRVGLQSATKRMRMLLGLPGRPLPTFCRRTHIYLADCPVFS